MHVNKLNADPLERVIRLIRASGYTFDSIKTALEDPAYQSADSYVGSRGLSWLQRWALSRGVDVHRNPENMTGSHVFSGINDNRNLLEMIFSFCPGAKIMYIHRFDFVF